MEVLEERAEIFEQRVAYIVSHLHRHRAEFVKEFTTFYGNYECDQLIDRSLEAFTRVGEEILRLDPADWTYDLLNDLTIDLESADENGKALVYLMIFETHDLGLAVYARSTRSGEMRFVGHIQAYQQTALGNNSHLRRFYTYEKALEISDKPPRFLVIARDPDADSEQCFVEHLESVVISMMDLCHSKDGKSLQLARGAQHSSLLSAQTHTKLEGLNRVMPVKQTEEAL